MRIAETERHKADLDVEIDLLKSKEEHEAAKAEYEVLVQAEDNVRKELVVFHRIKNLIQMLSLFVVKWMMHSNLLIKLVNISYITRIILNIFRINKIM